LRFSPVAFVFNIKHNWFDLAMGHFFSGQLILQLARPDMGAGFTRGKAFSFAGHQARPGIPMWISGG